MRDHHRRTIARLVSEFQNGPRFRNWGIDYISALVTFVEDTEWAWRTRRSPLTGW